MLCGRFWVGKPPQPDLKPAKTSKLCLLEKLHTTIQVKIFFCFLGQNFFTKNFDEKFRFK
jgi:hypothetical protein